MEQRINMPSGMVKNVKIPGTLGHAGDLKVVTRGLPVDKYIPANGNLFDPVLYPELAAITVRSHETPRGIHYAAFLGKLYVICRGVLYMSADEGVTWKMVSYGVTDYNGFDARDINSSATELVIVGTMMDESLSETTTYKQVALRSTNGKTFTAHTIWQDTEIGKAVNGLSQGGSLFVAVGEGGRIYTSPTGATWTSRTSNTSEDLNDCKFGNGYHTAVGTNGTIVTSANGTSGWTVRAVAEFTAQLMAVSAKTGVIIAVGAGGALALSADGVTFTEGDADTDDDLADIWYDSTNAKFVIAKGTSGLLTTADGVTFGTSSTGGGEVGIGCHAAALGKTFGVGTGNETGSIAITEDLDEWSNDESADLFAIFYVNGGNSLDEGTLVRTGD